MSELVTLPEFGVIKLTGEQSHEFLQGQVTCDIFQLREKAWIAGAHCNAKGKAWSAFLAFEQNQDLFLVMVKDSLKVTLAELNKYAVFAKTDITDDSANWYVYGVTGLTDSLNDNVTESDVIFDLTANHQLLVSKQNQEDKAIDSKEAHITWWQLEVASGRAHLYNNIIGEYVPQMMNLQALDYISFKKGCYMGQEMVARMRYLGKNKRALYIAEIDSEVELTPGQDIYREMNERRRKSGKVITSQAGNGKTVFQVVLPNDTEQSEHLFIDEESDVCAQIMPLPYTLEQD